jgi:hypothetical protein
VVAVDPQGIWSKECWWRGIRIRIWTAINGSYGLGDGEIDEERRSGDKWGIIIVSYRITSYNKREVLLYHHMISCRMIKWYKMTWDHGARRRSTGCHNAPFRASPWHASGFARVRLYACCMLYVVCAKGEVSGHTESEKTGRWAQNRAAINWVASPSRGQLEAGAGWTTATTRTARTTTTPRRQGQRRQQPTKAAKGHAICAQERAVGAQNRGQ